MAKIGRPTVVTDEVLKKLEYVFALGGTDKEACFYANISHQTLYSYQEKHPEFTERKEELKNNPVLKAKETIMKSLKDPKIAQWYLERKTPDFKPRQDVTSGDKPIPIMGGVSVQQDNSNG